MSYHIIHILNHASRLSADRGCLVCNIPNQDEKRIPFDDILAVIIAARGVSFSADCLSALIKNNAAVLHCDYNYKPIGKTVGLHRVVHNEIIDAQIHQDIDFQKEIWNKIIRAKTRNQAFILDFLNVKHKLWDYLKENNVDEGNAARHYWKYYFKAFGRSNPKNRITKGADDNINSCLNYGYAVISAICHRALTAHGFNTAIGVYHKYRFRSDPLVYDIMEPMRALCDIMLLRFRRQNAKISIDEWIKFAAKDILAIKVNVFGLKNIKIIFAIDKYIASFSHCFRNKTINNFYIPLLADMKFENEK